MLLECRQRRQGQGDKFFKQSEPRRGKRVGLGLPRPRGRDASILTPLGRDLMATEARQGHGKNGPSGHPLLRKCNGSMAEGGWVK